jgi:hypothetical protein
MPLHVPENSGTFDVDHAPSRMWDAMIVHFSLAAWLIWL